MSLDFMIAQTDKFNPQNNMPLQGLTISRDVKFTDIALGNTSTSFLRNTYGVQGSSGAQDYPWYGVGANTAPSVTFDAERVVMPVREWSLIVSINSIAEQRSMLTSVDIVQGKMYALQESYQTKLDQYGYVGAPDLEIYGLLNNPDISAGNAPFGDWLNASPDEIIYDVAEILTAAYENSAFAVYSGNLLLPVEQYQYIAQTPRSSLSDTTILKFLLENNISGLQGVPLKIYPVKWLQNPSYFAADERRMVAYTNDLKYVRLPIMPLQPHKAIENLYGYERSYIASVGQYELVYPETLLYRDGI